MRSFAEDDSRVARVPADDDEDCLPPAGDHAERRAGVRRNLDPDVRSARQVGLAGEPLRVRGQDVRRASESVEQGSPLVVVGGDDMECREGVRPGEPEPRCAHHATLLAKIPIAEKRNWWYRFVIWPPAGTTLEGTTAARAAITCLLADDHPAVLDAVARVLSGKGFDVVARARDGAEALAAIDRHRPNVSVVDLRMPRLSGVEVARRASGRTLVILYTGYGEQALLSEALEVGARGFVLKEAPLDDLARAIETVAAGAIYVDAQLATVLASGEATEKLSVLSKHERDVLRMLAEGMTSEQIAERLGTTAETIRAHSRAATAKLAADTRTQAVATAIRQQLID